MRLYKQKPNDYRVVGDTVHVKLSNAESEMLCDLDDWNRCAHLHWSMDVHGYAQAHISENRKRKTVLFHWLVLDCPPKMHRDHINRNRLDNRKINLRCVTFRENTAMNTKINKNNTSGYRGVYFDAKSGKWFAEIKHCRKSHRSIRFERIEDAVKERIRLEEKYFGRVVS